MAISDKLQELLDIKQDIKEALENKGVDLTDVAFSGYAEKIDEIPLPKEEQTKTVSSPNFSSGNVVVTPDAGKVLTQVTVVKDADLVPENIVKDVNIFGVVGTAETGGGGLTGGYRVTFDLANTWYNGVIISQPNSGTFVMDVSPEAHSAIIIIENVTYIKHTGSVNGQFLEGITKAELNAGKTLTNDIVLGGYRDYGGGTN
jgi:hypothetical protein